MKTTLLALCACVALVACSKSAPSQSDAAQAAPAQASSTAADGAAPQQASLQQSPQVEQQTAAAPPAPTPTPSPAPEPNHSYSYRENGQYGYESALSDSDQKAGLVTKPLQMYRYIGQVDGRYVVESVEDNAATRASCEAPCDFAKILTVNAYGQSQSNIMRLPPDSLLAAVLGDARSGQLQPSASPVAYLFPASWSPSVAPAQTLQSAAPAPSVQSAAQPDAPAVQPVTDAAAAQATPAATTYATSFDCSKARTDSEHLICGDPELAADDVQLAEIFARAKAAATDPAAFKQHTREEWNYRERTCHDRDCLVRWYVDQKTALEHIAQTGAL